MYLSIKKKDFVGVSHSRWRVGVGLAFVGQVEQGHVEDYFPEYIYYFVPKGR